MDDAVAMQRWEGAEAFLIAEAQRDLEPLGDHPGLDAVRPCLVAFAGAAPLLLAWWRCFDKGQALDPLVELMSLAVPLGADRVALSLSGRAWSLDDPVPPVLPGVGDLRQRVLHLTFVDDHEGRGHRTEVLYPYDMDGDRVVWGERRELGPSEGEVPQGMELLVRMRAELHTDDVEELAGQLRRCARLGHLVAVAPAVCARLGVDAADLRPGPVRPPGPRPWRSTRHRPRARRHH